MSLASYKNICNTFLRGRGFPVPEQGPATKADDIIEFMSKKQIDDIVVKPSRGWGGMGVTIRPHGEQEIRRAFNYALENSLSATSTKVIVEEFVHGRHFRLVVLGNTLIAAVERVAPYVIGNGKSTVEALVKGKNREYAAIGRPQIKLDKESDSALETQGLTKESIPDKDKQVTIRFNANMTSGGIVRECLDEVHPSYRKIAVETVQATGLKLAGLDLITPDITNPNVKFGINEVNHNPGLRLHYMPNEGKTVDICLAVQKYILANFHSDIP
jgi:cyanophycin synthetase